MTVQYASDLHLEFEYNRHYVSYNPLEPSADVLVLAGDICLLRSIEMHEAFFNYVSMHWKVTYWLPGNHEYYHSNAAERGDSFCEAIRENVFLVNNYTAIHNEVRLLFTTLWSYISFTREHIIGRGISDFQLIHYQNRKMTVPDFNRMHGKSVTYLESEFEKTFAKTIVVTHHVPTVRQYPPQYIDSPLNEAFVCSLDEMIENCGAAYWIYGHHHANVAPFNIGRTKMITNQLGYVHAYEQKGFDLAAIITI